MSSRLLASALYSSLSYVAALRETFRFYFATAIGHPCTWLVIEIRWGEMQRLEVDFEQVGWRLDVFLVSKLEDVSRARVQGLIREGLVKVGGKEGRASQRMSMGDEVEVVIPAAEPLQGVEAEEMPLEILYEDASLLVLNKPAGLVVHPGAGNATGTLVNALLHHCKDLSGIGGVERPGIVHRLDKETSGCLVVAKSDKVHQHLSDQFAGREVVKTYLAVIKGRPRALRGTIEAPIGRHPVYRQKMRVSEKGRSALTEYRVLEGNEKMALVECRPRTGRTHQIRVHLKHIGHPILGDPVYGSRDIYKRHLLHAWKLEFTHPETGQRMSFVAPIPEDILECGVRSAGCGM